MFCHRLSQIWDLMKHLKAGRVPWVIWVGLTSSQCFSQNWSLGDVVMESGEVDGGGCRAGFVDRRGP